MSDTVLRRILWVLLGFVALIVLGAGVIAALNLRDAGETLPMQAAVGTTPFESTLATRVRQLRTQVVDFIDLRFETCPYNRRSCWF